MNTMNPPTRLPYFLPQGYRERPANLTLDANRVDNSYWSKERAANAARFQTHVYQLAAKLMQRHHLRSILDVGCGVGAKLHTIIAPVCEDIEGIDQASAVAAASQAGLPARFSTADLECPSLTPHRTFDIILCADVVEHLVNPDPMLELIRAFCHPGTLLIISTPERHRLRGRACSASEKPEHVREWSRPEFRQFMASRGFHTISSFLFPQDDAPIRSHRAAELRFRTRQAEFSPLCCQALVCRSAGPSGSRR